MKPILLLVAILLPCMAPAVTPEKSEFETCQLWSDHALAGPAARAVFSFIFDGRPSTSLLASWHRQISPLPDGAWAVSYRDPATGLSLRAEVTPFKDFPAVEWVVHIQNDGARDTPVIENIQVLDADLGLMAAPEPLTLHWSRGGIATFDDFAPQQAVLRPGGKKVFDAGEGRSSSVILPFFNLRGKERGVIAAIGWSGDWAAEFSTDRAGASHLKAGMARTHLVLHPGERIRTPRMLLLFYEGDRWRGQNLLRRFVLAHHRPQLNGQPLVAPVTNGNWGGTSAAVHLDNIRKIAEHDLKIDYYWIDAEWYGKPGGTDSWAVNVGNWAYKRDLYPAGFRPLSDLLRRNGRELMLWFEPERVYKGTSWDLDHPEWILDTGRSSKLFNLGIPAAREFLTNFLSDRIREFGLGCYRQDFNIDPLPFWKKGDAPDRQGMTEIRYIEGLYAYWDGLLRRFPGLMIDNCASGGRRIDLETIGRATPFWRTDAPRDPIVHQCHTYGLLAWVPLNATSVDKAPNDYDFRSGMSSALCLNWWVEGDKPSEAIPDDFPYAWAKKTLDQYAGFRAYYYGDYYPLTAYSQEADVWMAYQLDRPESGDGLLVILRRQASPYEFARLPLRALDAAATYEVTNLDGDAPATFTGTELTTKGLPVTLKQKPDTLLLRYRRR
jgi:alpha-galactosidase